MALRLVIHTLFMLLVCIASPRIVTFPQKGTNGIDSLNLSVPESHVTTLNQSTSSGSFWSAQHASNKPVKIDTSLIPAGNVHNLTNLHLATPRIQCDGSAYGLGLQIASCIDAWGLIPTDTIRRTFGKRTLGTFDVPLPLRLFSSDGRCGIDIALQGYAISDASTDRELSLAAALILRQCVLGDMQQGGVAADLGELDSLSVRIVSYNPSNVVCLGAGLFQGACSSLLGTMPADNTQQKFGPYGKGDTRVDVTLPKAFSHPSGQCIITANYVGMSSYTSWHTLYLAAAAIDAMCVRRGLTGVMNRIGIEASLLVTIGGRNSHTNVAATS